MSLVIAAPDLLQTAAQDLESIGSSPAEVTASVAAPTTAIVAAGGDEVSHAIAALFSNLGEEYRILSAEAQLFHEQFVNLLNAGAGTYLSTEAANAENLLSAATRPVAGLFEQSIGGTTGWASGGTGGAIASVLTAAESAGLGSLLSGTAAPLSQRISGVVSAVRTGTAVPLLTGQIGAGLHTLTGGIANLQGALGGLERTLPPELFHPGTGGGLGAFGAAITGPYADLIKNTATNLQLVGGSWDARPAPLLSQFLHNQIGYGQLIGHSLESAAYDFGTGLHALPTAFQTAFNEFIAGNYSGALETLGTGFVNLFYNGISVDLATGSVTVLGSVGDLLPIFNIPGVMAHNFANLVTTALDTNITFSIFPLGFNVGLPLAFIGDLIGSPVTTLSAVGSSATAFYNAVVAGDGPGALAALIDAPAVVANGFLNGHANVTVPLPTSVIPFPGVKSVSVTLPLGGILTPTADLVLTIDYGTGPISAPLEGTQLGGIIPGGLQLLDKLADAIAA